MSTLVFTSFCTTLELLFHWLGTLLRVFKTLHKTGEGINCIHEKLHGIHKQSLVTPCLIVYVCMIHLNLITLGPAFFTRHPLTTLFIRAAQGLSFHLLLECLLLCLASAALVFLTSTPLQRSRPRNNSCISSACRYRPRRCRLSLALIRVRIR